ncbi:unnamed protein product [Caenorhabditis bovis]|uniref:Uncharacterized protein n=1 Tax=Caenorhabditis bovis TaxID=2654633 RepID=A0A8S1F8K5_9PELO|nr:unnamed protein product [Caenorhabditis bovis]
MFGEQIRSKMGLKNQQQPKTTESGADPKWNGTKTQILTENQLTSKAREEAVNFRFNTAAVNAPQQNDKMRRSHWGFQHYSLTNEQVDFTASRSFGSSASTVTTASSNSARLTAALTIAEATSEIEMPDGCKTRSLTVPLVDEKSKEQQKRIVSMFDSRVLPLIKNTVKQLMGNAEKMERYHLTRRLYKYFAVRENIRTRCFPVPLEDFEKINKMLVDILTSINRKVVRDKIDPLTAIDMILKRKPSAAIAYP